jgi:hypothetical protein
MTPAWNVENVTPMASETPKYTQITLTSAGTPRNTFTYNAASHDTGGLPMRARASKSPTTTESTSATAATSAAVSRPSRSAPRLSQTSDQSYVAMTLTRPPPRTPAYAG